MPTLPDYVCGVICSNHFADWLKARKEKVVQTSSGARVWVSKKKTANTLTQDYYKEFPQYL